MFRHKKDDDAKIPGMSPPVTSGLNVEGELAPSPKLYGKRQPTLSPVRSDIPRRGTVDLPGATRRYPADPHEGKKLIVGRDIELAGEITACDRLVVEGKVAADLTDAGIIEIAQTGMFRGSADVGDADISGLFDGTLTVRRKLIIRGTGQVRGTIRYARIVIEQGGEIHGTVDTIVSETKNEDQIQQLTSPPTTVMIDSTS